MCHRFPVLTTIARTIINKYNRATAKESENRDYFDELNAVPTAEEIGMWEAEISEAEEKRTSQPDAMDVMACRIPKGQLLDLSDSPDLSDD
jgi:hypothetical protein